MKTPALKPRLVRVAVCAAVSASLALPVFAQVDEEAAKTLFKENECQKCHNPVKDKKGPSLKKIAEKYKKKGLGAKDAVKHMTTGKKVKLDDGTEEDHKILDTKDSKAQENLANWILSH